jgi:hypothetical protein
MTATKVWVRAGGPWRIARLLSIKEGMATVQFPGTDDKHMVPVAKCRKYNGKRGTA